MKGAKYMIAFDVHRQVWSLQKKKQPETTYYDAQGNELSHTAWVEIYYNAYKPSVSRRLKEYVSPPETTYYDAQGNELKPEE